MHSFSCYTIKNFDTETTEFTESIKAELSGDSRFNDNLSTTVDKYKDIFSVNAVVFVSKKRV